MIKQMVGIIKDKLVDGRLIQLSHLTMMAACIGGMREPPTVAMTCPAPANFIFFPV